MRPQAKGRTVSRRTYERLRAEYEAARAEHAAALKDQARLAWGKFHKLADRYGLAVGLCGDRNGERVCSMFAGHEDFNYPHQCNTYGKPSGGTVTITVHSWPPKSGERGR